MMRSESKEIYGVDVFGIISMLKEIRRWWIIRGLRDYWKKDRYFLVMCRKFKHLNHHIDSFNVQQRYEFVSKFAKHHQQRGVI